MGDHFNPHESWLCLVTLQQKIWLSKGEMTWVLQLPKCLCKQIEKLENPRDKF
jgi:hypothetical protein